MLACVRSSTCIFLLLRNCSASRTDAQTVISLQVGSLHYIHEHPISWASRWLLPSVFLHAPNKFLLLSCCSLHLCHEPCRSAHPCIAPPAFFSLLFLFLPSLLPVGLGDPLVPHGCCSTGAGHVGARQEGHYVGEYACSQLRGLKARVLITAEQSIINPALEYQIPVRLGHCLGILKSSETEIISFRMTHCQIKHFSYYPFLPLSLSCSLSWII